eukprot:UN24955
MPRQEGERTYKLQALDESQYRKWKKRIFKFIPNIKRTMFIRPRKTGWMEKVKKGYTQRNHVRFFVLRRNLEYYVEAEKKRKRVK